MLQRLTPSMKHRGDADLRVQMLGIGGDGGERLSGSAEQDRIDGGLVLEGNLARQRWQCEDDVEVRHRQQFGLSMREPFLRGGALALRAVPVAAEAMGRAAKS